ncbi:MAG: hypothetical protein MUF58_18200 [Arcicella sp.]|nr:hypothetical protein [Arcicella sp.]
MGNIPIQLIALAFFRARAIIQKLAKAVYNRTVRGTCQCHDFTRSLPAIRFDTKIYYSVEIKPMLIYKKYKSFSLNL